MAEASMNFEYPPGASPAEIWAILRKVAEDHEKTRLEMQEQRQEADRQMQETREQMKETDRRMQETDRLIKETAKQMKETDKKVGELSNRFGELAEHLVAPSIREKFNALGFTFTRASENVSFTDISGNHIAEVDILLENGDTAIAVEVKAKPKEKDVEEHIKRMQALRRCADDRHDRRIFQGAIAGAIMSNEVRAYILKRGMYVIEQTGDTVKINIPEGFKAREW